MAANYVGMKVGPNADVKNHQDQTENCADPTARTLVLRADLVADEPRQFREQNCGEQYGDDPRIDAGEPIGCETMRY